MNESLKLNEKYKDTKNLQKREVKLKQLKKEEQSGNVPSIKKVSSHNKISEQEKQSIKTNLEALKEAVKKDDLEDIKSKHEQLQKAVYAVSEKIYKAAAAAANAQNAQNAGANPNNASSQNDKDVVDVDYKDVDGEKK